MLRDAIVRIITRLAAILLTVLAIIAIAAYIYSALSSLEFYPTFKSFLFYGGIIIIAVGAYLGMGVAEVAYVENKAFTLNAKYQRAIVEGRGERRREQFAMMILCVAVGVPLIILPYII